MIIFGWRGRSSIEHTGLFNCPVCKAKTQFVISKTRPWFTLFFLPIFPVGSGIRAKICAGCGTILDPDRENQPPVLASSIGAAPAPMANANQAARPGFSSLAIISLIAGFLSPIFIIACFLSIITSTVAIVTGHIALYKIKRSANQLDGRAVAIVGVVLGYISMALTIACIAYIFTRPPSNAGTGTYASGQTPSQRRLDEAELSVVSGSKNSIGQGNNELARTLATNFANEMKRADELVFTTNRKPGFQLSGGEYRTYCELHENSCAFIVHVPSYRSFTDEAKEALNSIAWLTALVTVKDHLTAGDSLAVGLRGAVMYGDILVGTVTDDPKKLDKRIGSAKDLVPFFETGGKRSLDPGKLAKDDSPFAFPAELPSTSEEPSPFDPPKNAAPAAPESVETGMAAVEPKMSEAIESTARVAVLPKDVPAEPNRAEPKLAERPRVANAPSNAPTNSGEKSRPKSKPKPEVPAFENKIPVTLLNSIDAQGWNIQSMIFNQANDRLITGGLDETLSVFDIRTGKMLFRSKRQEELGQVVSLALSKDGETIFAGGYTGRVATYDMKPDGKLEFVRSLYKHNRNAECLVVSPTFPFVLSGGEDGTVTWQPFDDRSNSLKMVQELKRKVLAAHLFRDRNEGLATDGQTLIRFSVRDSKVLDQQTLSRSYPHAAAISPDGKRCAVSYGSEFKLFETESGQQIEEIDSKGVVWTLEFHPTKPWIVAGSSAKAIIWDADSAEKLAELDAGSIQNIATIAITNDGKTLAMIPSSAGQSIRVFDLTR